MIDKKQEIKKESKTSADLKSKSIDKIEDPKKEGIEGEGCTCHILPVYFEEPEMCVVQDEAQPCPPVGIYALYKYICVCVCVRACVRVCVRA